MPSMPTRFLILKMEFKSCLREPLHVNIFSNLKIPKRNPNETPFVTSPRKLKSPVSNSCGDNSPQVPTVVIKVELVAGWNVENHGKRVARMVVVRKEIITSH